jgi:hypothetical protein
MSSESSIDLRLPRLSELRPSRRSLTVVFLLSLLITETIVVLSAGLDGKAVRRGQSRGPSVTRSIPLTPWKAERARVQWIGEPTSFSQELERRGCLMYLGQAGGNEVFFDAQNDKRLFLPSGSVVTTLTGEAEKCSEPEIDG